MSPRIARFQRDESNVAHIARHEVTPLEVEQAFLDSAAILKPYGVRNGELRYTMLGETTARRLLLVVYVIRGGAIRTVTAYTADRKDEASYAAARRP